MPQKPRLIQLPLAGKVFLVVLAIVYTIYLVALVRYLSPVGLISISEHATGENLSVVMQHWTVANMQSATDADEQINNTTDLTEQSSDTSAAKAAQQEGQPRLVGNPLILFRPLARSSLQTLPAKTLSARELPLSARIRAPLILLVTASTGKTTGPRT